MECRARGRRLVCGAYLATPSAGTLRKVYSVSTVAETRRQNRAILSDARLEMTRLQLWHSSLGRKLPLTAVAAVDSNTEPSKSEVQAAG